MLREGSLKTSYHQYQLIGIFFISMGCFSSILCMFVPQISTLDKWNYELLCSPPYWFFCLLVLQAVKKELKDFSFSYSMESVDNYKLMVLFDSDKTFRIEEYNYYMDNFAKKRDPKIMEGDIDWRGVCFFKTDSAKM